MNIIVVTGSLGKTEDKKLTNNSYDIIGDIHGYAETLKSLLEKLGYRETNGIFRHHSRTAIFLGDFVDRGPAQRGVIETVRPMIESGTALSVMGNHEFNAIAYSTCDESGGFLREHSEKNLGQHEAFLDAYEESDDYEETINWFKTLPLWLDLGGLRIIHACWDQRAIDSILDYQSGRNRLSEELLRESCRYNSCQFKAVETILKGKEIPLPCGFVFEDKEGTPRHNIRVRWWDASATTFKRAFMGPESARTHIPDDEIQGDHLVDYSHDAPPVFLGHYWLEGKPAKLAPNIACLDYSVAKSEGKLVAYRWDGEQTLDDDNFVWVERVEPQP